MLCYHHHAAASFHSVSLTASRRDPIDFPASCMGLHLFPVPHTSSCPMCLHCPGSTFGLLSPFLLFHDPPISSLSSLNHCNLWHGHGSSVSGTRQCLQASFHGVHILKKQVDANVSIEVFINWRTNEHSPPSSDISPLAPVPLLPPLLILFVPPPIHTVLSLSSERSMNAPILRFHQHWRPQYRWHGKMFTCHLSPKHDIQHGDNPGQISRLYVAGKKRANILWDRLTPHQRYSYF